MQFSHLSLVSTSRMSGTPVRQHRSCGASLSPPPNWAPSRVGADAAGVATLATARADRPRWVHSASTDLPQVLVVTAHPLRYTALAVSWDHASDGLAAVATVRHGLVQGLAYGVILIDVDLGVAGGYAIVRELRGAGALMPIHLLAQSPLPSDRYRAQQSGASGLLCRNTVHLTRLVVECLAPARQRAGAAEAQARQPPIPGWFDPVVTSLREFLASEAQPQALAIYAELQRRAQGGVVRCADLVREAAALIDEPRERASFVRYARHCVCAEASR
jgi:CheY-like chemotaxis protein